MPGIELKSKVAEYENAWKYLEIPKICFLSKINPINNANKVNKPNK